MKRKTKITLVAALILTGTLLLCVAFREFAGTESFDQAFYATSNDQKDEPSNKNYAAILGKHVDARGMVDYATLAENPGKLHEFVRSLASVELKTYTSWNEQEKLAFWINAYNGLTLKAIIDHYPIRAGLLSSVRYPANSIRQIPGVWDKIQFLVIGNKLTLNEIEHGILRGKNKKLIEKFGRFDEPRIHVALVCAAMGCPPLRNEPFVGDKLDEQLNDQAKRFLSNNKKFHIDRNAGKVSLSAIFKWFGEDFAKKYKAADGFASGGSDANKAVLNFISGYLSASDSEELKVGNYKLEHLDYDWSLNEQKQK